MVATLALEIGAVFLFAALLMHLSSRGFMPEILKHVRWLVIAAGLLIAGFTVYRWAAPQIDFWPASSRTPAAASTAPAPAKVAPARIAPVPRARIREVESPIEIAPAPAPPVVAAPAEEPAVTEEAPAPEKGNRVKRWIRSVGRAFHPKREKEPQQ